MELPVALWLTRARSGRKKTRPQGFDPNRARKERAGELRALQASAKALNARLEALQAVGSGQSEELRAVQARRHDQEKELQVWDELRQSQLALRLEAETENARLKSALEEARRLADALQRAAIKSSRGLVCGGMQYLSLMGLIANAVVIARLYMELQRTWGLRFTHCFLTLKPTPKCLK